ncbi:DUF2971 domain-containing protein [Acinetobacter junii]|uniref:DUF2971 domain-containing protein n=1 Tax=Acinetobacter junii TaxID=40215 RepID=UPI0024B72563|nr:DUF2971 domain-containing protein [Acinetobacter junii]MDI9720512.1 DUF2971 domain-containing protein [Acinetobacter junii]
MSLSYKNLIEENIQAEYQKVIQDDDFYYLYKHYSLDPEHLTLGVFNNCQLKYQYPLYFNDPYDCLCSIKLDFSSFKKRDFEEFTNSKVSVSNWFKKKESYLKIANSNFNSKEYIESFRKFFAVTCFNNSPLNILMWSHYAKNHKGFMLEFRFKKITDNYINLPLPVIYTDEYPCITVPWNLKSFINDDELSSEFIAKQLLIKSRIWSYEHEFRQMNNAGLLKKYNPNMLSSVILGSEIEDADEKAIINSVQNFNKANCREIKIFKTSLVEDKFELTVKGHPRLSK